MKSTIKLSIDAYRFLMELAEYEYDNRPYDEDEAELWKEAKAAEED
jgi:hypothetical protein